MSLDIYRGERTPIREFIITSMKQASSSGGLATLSRAATAST